MEIAAVVVVLWLLANAVVVLVAWAVHGGAFDRAPAGVATTLPVPRTAPDATLPQRTTIA